MGLLNTPSVQYLSEFADYQGRHVHASLAFEKHHS